MIPSPEDDWPITELEEDLIDAYVEWREGATAAADAYRRWADAPSSQRAHWFLVYTAALNHEEFAAIGLALAMAEVERREQRDRGRRTKQ